MDIHTASAKTMFRGDSVFKSTSVITDADVEKFLLVISKIIETNSDLKSIKHGVEDFSIHKSIYIIMENSYNSLMVSQASNNRSPLKWYVNCRKLENNKRGGLTISGTPLEIPENTSADRFSNIVLSVFNDFENGIPSGPKIF